MSYLRQWCPYTRSFTFQSLPDLCEFINLCGGDIDLNKISIRKNFSIGRTNGQVIEKGGVYTITSLLEEFNKLYDTKIDLLKSRRTGTTYRIVFDEYPIKNEEINVKEREEEEENPQNRKRKTLEKLAKEAKEAIRKAKTYRPDGGDVEEREGIPTPVWKEVTTLNKWTKNDLEYVARYGYDIILDRSNSFYNMKKQFIEEVAKLQEEIFNE